MLSLSPYKRNYSRFPIFIPPLATNKCIAIINYSIIALCLSTVLLDKIIAGMVVTMREKKEINIQIGERIKAAREQTKMTQECLAERIEVSPQYVSDLERGVVGVSLTTLKKICLVLNVSSDQLLFGANGEAISPVMQKCSCLSKEHFAILCEIIDRYIFAVSM